MFNHTALSLSGGYVPPPVLKIEPGDVLLLQSPHRLNQDFMRRTLDKAKELFPGHRVIFFADGLTLTAFRGTTPVTSHPSETSAPPDSSTDH